MPSKSAELNAKKSEVVKQALQLLGEGTPEARSKAAELTKQAEDLEQQAHEWVILEKMEAAQNESTGVITGHSSMPHTDRRNIKSHFGGYHEYSINRALLQMSDEKRVTGLEAEVSQALAQRSGKRPQGMLIPYDLPFNPNLETRNLSTTTGAGALQVAVSDTIIEKLRAQVLIYQLGATVLNDMVGEFRLPRQSTLANTVWVGSGGNVSTGNLAIAEQVVFTPTTVGSFMDIDRRFIMNVSLDAESWTRAELISAVGLATDYAAFAGAGANNEPLGLLHNPNCLPIVFGAPSTGAAPTFAKMVAFETALGQANALVQGGRFGYVTNHKVKGVLKTSPRIVVNGATTTYGQNMIWENGMVNDYPAFATTNIPSDFAYGGTEDGAYSGVIFGNWKDLIAAFYSGMDVLVDPYTGGLAGTIRVIIMQDLQIKLRQDVSFAVGHDALAA